MILAQVLFDGDSTSGPFQIALIVCALFAAAIGRKNGHDLRDLGKNAVDGISAAMGAIFILLAVGALIGTWSMAGTTATLTYYGVKLINPAWFYLACVIICGLISLSIGSSWTTVGTIGVALVAIAGVLRPQYGHRRRGHHLWFVFWRQDVAAVGYDESLAGDCGHRFVYAHSRDVVDDGAVAGDYLGDLWRSWACARK